MTVMPNSTAARDIAYHLHPYTNAVKQEAEGLAGADARQGHLRL